jgi:hypothetical protein
MAAAIGQEASHAGCLLHAMWSRCEVDLTDQLSTPGLVLSPEA